MQPPKFYKRYSLVKVWLIDIKSVTSHNYSGNWLFGSIKHACLPAKKDFSGRKITKQNKTNYYEKIFTFNFMLYAGGVQCTSAKNRDVCLWK